MLFTQLADNGSDSFAGSTPGCEEVDDDGAGGDEGFEDDLAVGWELALRSLSATTSISYLSISVTFP